MRKICINQQKEIKLMPLFRNNISNNGKWSKIKEIPLSKDLNNKNNITLKSNSEIKENYEGIFSFVFYYRKSLEDFKKSIYYIGLIIYAEIIHNIKYFENYSMIIYTDKYTAVNILTKIFSNYENIIIAIVKWNKYTIDNEKIEGSILRCLRFNALEAFPNSDIYVRDADTIFTSEIRNLQYALESRIINDYRPLLIEKIGYFEIKFIEEAKKNPHFPILLGISLSYKREWHSDFLLNYSLTIKNKTERGQRFRNYPKKFYFDSPFGIYAGFTNFLKSRPTDIWTYFYDYINRHYKLYNGQISDKHLWILDIGKDERIIIFTLIVRHLEKCFFFHLSLQSFNSFEYFSKENMNKRKQNLENFKKNFKKNFFERKMSQKHVSRYLICNMIIEPIVLLNLGNVKGENPITYNYEVRNLNIMSELLNPNYIEAAFSKNITENMVSNNLCKMKRNNINKSINEFYTEQFRKFSELYLAWLKSIYNIPIENLKKNINQIVSSKSKEEGYINSYNGLSLTKFNNPPSLIPKSNINNSKSLKVNSTNKNNSGSLKVNSTNKNNSGSLYRTYRSFISSFKFL
jgi:hypothetical protein